MFNRQLTVNGEPVPAGWPAWSPKAIHGNRPVKQHKAARESSPVSYVFAEMAYFNAPTRCPKAL